MKQDHKPCSRSEEHWQRPTPTRLCSFPCPGPTKAPSTGGTCRDTAQQTALQLIFCLFVDGDASLTCYISTYTFTFQHDKSQHNGDSSPSHCQEGNVPWSEEGSG